MSDTRLLLSATIGLLLLVGLAGCIPDPTFDRWTIDALLLEDSVVFSQTFRNVRVESNRDGSARAQEWYCDDGSDTFQRHWREYADRVGMRTLRSKRARTSDGAGCDVQITGHGRSFLPTAVVLSELLDSQNYSVSRDGDRFELSISPDTRPRSINAEFNIWLSDRYQGRLVDTNAGRFERELSHLRVGFHTLFPDAQRSRSWRRARWTSERLVTNGVHFVLDGPLFSTGDQRPGVDNRPTRIPGDTR